MSYRASEHVGTLGRASAAVRDALDARNRTQGWLATQVGITEKHLSRVLTGRAQGSFALWDDLLAAVGLVLVVVPRDWTGWPT